MKMPFGQSLTRCRTSLALLVALGLARTAGAQDDQNMSPRAAMQAFLTAARSGHYGRAAQVAFPRAGQGPGFADPAQTARELDAVLNNYIVFDLSRIPDTPDAHTKDRAASDLVEIGRVASPGGRYEAIYLERRPNTGWVFAPVTLNHVPLWYSELPDRWIRDRLPEPLLRAGPKGLLWWQWLAVPILLLLAYILGRLIALGIRLILHIVSHRLPRIYNNAFLRRLGGPVTLALTVIVAAELVGFIFITVPAQQFVRSLAEALSLVALFWAALRLVDFGIGSLRESPFAHGRPERLALLPLFSKAAKITLGIIAIIEVLQKLGYPAASLIAGLGIGGLAVALAAQKTVENLFGSVILGVDQPFRPGDYVKVDDLTGTVENVGIRSTRIRTDGRTVVTIPNGRLSDMRIESFAPRDRLNLSFKMTLVYMTRADQMRRIIYEIRAYLTALSDVRPGSVSVYFSTLGKVGLDVDVFASVNTVDDGKFQSLRQEALLRIMEIVEWNGSAFAVPPA